MERTIIEEHQRGTGRAGQGIGNHCGHRIGVVAHRAFRLADVPQPMVNVAGAACDGDTHRDYPLSGPVRVSDAYLQVGNRE